MEGWLFDWWPLVAISFFVVGFLIVWIEMSRGKMRPVVDERKEQQLPYRNSCSTYDECGCIKS